ncbi:MAG: hypothetical protein FWD83_08645 [Promicromonosporaceae bacterium]|nr:hypothetical protein [Promicromonosporaceae bacterium]
MSDIAVSPFADEQIPASAPRMERHIDFKPAALVIVALIAGASLLLPVITPRGGSFTWLESYARETYVGNAGLYFAIALAVMVVLGLVTLFTGIKVIRRITGALGMLVGAYGFFWVGVGNVGNGTSAIGPPLQAAAGLVLLAVSAYVLLTTEA